MNQCEGASEKDVEARVPSSVTELPEHSMETVVFKHVRVTDLPEQWRSKLKVGAGATVTVGIEPDAKADGDATDNPLFAMWRDREDMADVAGYVRKLRAARFGEDGESQQGP